MEPFSLFFVYNSVILNNDVIKKNAMSIKDRKSRENAQLRQKILTAALRVFAEQGYGKVSMRKIAALIDYSPTTIYRFFRNKEDLLLTIAVETYRDLSAGFEKIKAKGRDNPLGMLKSLVREYIIFCVERPDMFRLYSDLGSFELEDGIIYERLGGTRYKVYQSWFSCIRQSIESDSLELEDDLRIFLYLWDAANGYIASRIHHPGIPRKPLADDSDEFLSLIFRGIETRKNS
jgi:AcrR family transcriptional regulator